MNIHKIKNAQAGAPLSLIAGVPAGLAPTLVGAFRQRYVRAEAINPNEFVAECQAAVAWAILSDLALEAHIGEERALEVPA